MASRQEAPWPGWEAIALDDGAISRCSADSIGHSKSYWALSKDGMGRVVPRASHAEPKPPRWDALPVTEVPPELGLAAMPGARRRVLQGDSGWLVAMDVGEFGGGLFALDKGASAARRLDAELPEPVRWIERFEFGIVGVAGLCHGEGCAAATYVYRIDSAVNGWALSPLSRVKGCPARIMGAAGGTEALLLTCRALHSITASGVAAVATWQEGLFPVIWDGAATRDAKGAVYVSFGQMVGSFPEHSSPTWYAHESCSERGTASSDPLPRPGAP